VREQFDRRLETALELGNRRKTAGQLDVLFHRRTDRLTSASDQGRRQGHGHVRLEGIRTESGRFVFQASLSHAGKPQTHQMAARVKDAIGRVEHCGRMVVAIPDQPHVTAVGGDAHHRKAQLVAFHNPPIRPLATHVRLAAAGLVLQVLDPRQNRLRLCFPERSQARKQRQHRQMENVPLPVHDDRRFDRDGAVAGRGELAPELPIRTARIPQASRNAERSVGFRQDLEVCGGQVQVRRHSIHNHAQLRAAVRAGRLFAGDLDAETVPLPAVMSQHQVARPHRARVLAEIDNRRTRQVARLERLHLQRLDPGDGDAASACCRIDAQTGTWAGNSTSYSCHWPSSFTVNRTEF